MALSGKNGKVSNANGATQIMEWTFAEVAEPLDITNFDSAGFREFLVGLEGASGSLTLVGTHPTTGPTSSDLELDVGSAIGDLRFSAEAILGEVETSVAADGVVTFSVDFTITGTVTVTTVP